MTGGIANGSANGSGRGSVIGESEAAPLGRGEDATATAPAIPRPAPTQPVGPPRPIVPSPARPSGPSQPTRPEPGAAVGRTGGVPGEKALVEGAVADGTRDESAAVNGTPVNRVAGDGAAVNGVVGDGAAVNGVVGDGVVGDEGRGEAGESGDFAGQVARTSDNGPLGDQVIEVRVDGPRPTPASVIARIQGQGTPAAVYGDWAQAQAEPTQAIHLVIPGHPAASRPGTRAEEGEPGQGGGLGRPDGAFDTGETIAAEPLETVGDLTGPTGHGRESVVVEFGRSGDAAESTSNKPLAEGGLLAQAQGRVDGTFTPSQTSGRPNGLGLGRPAPAAWRKAAESVAARAAGLTAPDEALDADQPVKAPAAKARTTRTTKKAETELSATARTRAAKAAKPAAEAVKPAARRVSGTPEAAEPRTTRAAVAKSAPAANTASKQAAASAAGKQAAASVAGKQAAASAAGKPAVGAGGKAAPSGSPAKPVVGKPAARSTGARPNGSTAGATAAGAAGTSGRGAAEGGDTAASRASYRAEAAELLAGATARRRRRTAGEPEPRPEPPVEKPRRRGAADRD